MQLPNVIGGRAQPAHLPSITQLFLSRSIRFLTLVWVACLIALTVHWPDATAKRANPYFLPPAPDSNEALVEEPGAISQKLQPLMPFLASQEGQAGMAVIDGGHQLVMQSDAHRKFVLASVTKLYIMTTYLNLVASENRDLSGDERNLLADMIEASDNDAASTLWDRIGKAEGLQRYLASRQLPPVEVPAGDDESWGDVRADAVGVGSLLTGLYEGRLLPPELTAVALHLMSHVIDSQSWGIGVVTRYDKQAPESGAAAQQVYLKDGWYPEDDGWVVNSAGVIARGAEHYVVVVLTDGQPSFQAGVELIEAATAFAAEQLP